MGFNCSRDENNRRADIAFENVAGVVRVVDDLLKFDSWFSEHVAGLCKLLDAARVANITLGSKIHKKDSTFPFCTIPPNDLFTFGQTI